MYYKVAFRYLPFILALFVSYNVSASEDTLQLNPDKVNLALRRTADKLLRMAGDSTSRIPDVQQKGKATWRVYLDQPFEYSQLPPVLQNSLDLYGIHQSYDVAIRQCESAIIDLGYHQADFLQDSLVPCGGRAEPGGCHYIEITFLNASVAKNSAGIAKIILPVLLLAAGAILFLWYRKRNLKKVIIPDGENWIEFGHSRLKANSQILESGNMKHQLTYRETKLLRLFASNPNQLLDRDFILQQVWADEGIQVGRSIDVFVSRLRKKLVGDSSIGIVAVHGVGYRLETGL